MVELLVVVAIIAILALIAVPNFLDAQTRSKVSRQRVDLRVVAVALEAYCADQRRYPTSGLACIGAVTTPIAYLMSAEPFRNQYPTKHLSELGFIEQGFPYLEYERYIPGADLPPNLGMEEVVRPQEEYAAKVHGAYVARAGGPFTQYPAFTYKVIGNVAVGLEVLYDPTNGTISPGFILRSQKSVGP